MVDGPFSRAPDKPLPTKTAVSVVAVFFVAAALRLVDAAVLLRWPRLWWAFVRTSVRGLWLSPYDEGGFERVAASKRAGLSKKALTYGETTVWGARRILRWAGAGRGERVLDLGCGRGRVLLAARSLGADARGVELLAGHVEAVQQPLAAVGIDVVHGEAATAPLDDVDCVYLTWTCFSETARQRLATHLGRLRPGARVVTVSWPLEAPGFVPRGAKTAWFSWGRADVFVQERTGPGDVVEESRQVRTTDATNAANEGRS